MSDISERLYNCIQAKGYSYGDLAKLTGIPKSAIQRYATGQTSKIPLDRLQTLADVLMVSTQYLMGWEGQQEQKPPAETDEELNDYLEDLRDRPELRMLFSLTRNATKEDVEAAVRIIEALRGGQFFSGDN